MRPLIPAELDIDALDGSELRASWIIGEPLPRPSSSASDSLQFFLTERYCLDTEHNGQLYRARIHHQPWPLQEGTLHSFSSTMIESHSLPTPQGDPLLHYCGDT